MKKIKVGDVILNHHASERNPIRISVITNINDPWVYCLSYSNKKHISKYDKYGIEQDDKFEIIGNIDFIGFIKSHLKLIENELQKTK